ncbi:PepSY domain-containing protein [Pseudenhygromyxa sp. WMMC2535]|uniref:PepSY-associated TM helix domain-containing protein n=1 Tax=Pseudenhygromyxa sp. WMMC2535 TaxID=2712867 RepID=UPI0015570026|nr:PepSY-associated TM helix domain-containing protein [Pseudenhygromyxa sp. WMMC2535]NVB36599.1 PepSY domain-containing protein [Pseudenhygromyxa sp. WMMC2535]
MSEHAKDALRRPRPRLYVLHRWIGLVLAVVGTLVFFSGALATFAAEIDRWASREHYPSVDAIADFDFDEAVARAAEEVDPRFHENIDAEQEPGEPLQFHFYRLEDSGEWAGVGIDMDPRTLEILDRREGGVDEVWGVSPRHALARFVIDLHVLLLLPRTLGLLATGLVGLGLLMLVASGVWVHRPTRAKLARRPRRKRLRLWVGDLHTLVGSWTLPFTAVLAMTGAFYSLSSTVLLPGVTAVAFDGDVNAMYETLYGEAKVPPAEGSAAPESLYRDARARSEGASFRSLGLHAWGGAGAHAMVTLERSRPLAGGEVLYYLYEGHGGEFLQAKPEFGGQPSAGGSLLRLVDELHFGTLLGLATRAAWLLLGLATCGLSATGLLIYTQRQRRAEAGGEGDTGTLRLTRALAVAMSAGLPATAALVLAAWALGYGLGGDAVGELMCAGLVLGLGLTATIGWRLELRAALALVTAAAGLGWLVAPLLVALANGCAPLRAWSQGEFAINATGDLMAVALGVGLLALARRLRTPTPTPQEAN